MSAPLRGLRVLVTRPQPQADKLARLLEGQGAIATVLPMLTIQPVAEEALPQSVDISHYHKVIVISPLAAEQLFVRYPHPHLSATGLWFTPGPGTADMLQTFGIRAHHPRQLFTSEAMLMLDGLQEVTQQRILLVKGEGGRELLEQTLTRRGADVHTLSLYRRACPKYPEGLLDRTIAEQQPDAIVATSSQIIQNLLDSSVDTRLLLSLPLLIPSSRIADLASDLGFTRVLTTSGAGDGNIAATLRKLVW